MEKYGAAGNMDINITKVNIIKCQCDAIVNSISKDYRFSGPIAKEIKKKWGETIIHEWVSAGQDKYEDGLSEGAVIPTSGGNSKYSFVYHVVLGSYKKNSTERYIKDILLEVLDHANMNGLSSVGVPPFGTGGNRTPMKIWVRAIFEAIREYSKKYKKPQCNKIEICIFDEETYESFQKEYGLLNNNEDHKSSDDDNIGSKNLKQPGKKPAVYML